MHPGGKWCIWLLLNNKYAGKHNTGQVVGLVSLSARWCYDFYVTLTKAKLVCICHQNARNFTYEYILKGLFTIFLFSVKSHILKSNGVWYSWFWPKGPINARNSTFLGFNFVPRDLDSRRHMGPRLAAQGTLTQLLSKIWDLNNRKKIGEQY